MRDDNWRPGPHVPRAHRVEFAYCEDPKCGLHVLSLDKNDAPICESVLSATQTLALIDICKAFLYEKATEQ